MTIKRARFQVRQFDPRTLSWWRSRRKEIDMEPPYQRRGRLWSSSDKAYLIDSIINGFDIPKVYVADFTWGDSALNRKKLPYAIIDGKQRFEAIFDFYEGSLVLQEDFLLESNPKLSLGGLGYKDLLRKYPDVAEAFDNYALHVMAVYAESEDPIQELFVRLNRSKPLTGAEVRNAMAGPVPEVIRQIAAHEFFADIVRFSVQRGQDLNAAAKVIVFEYYDKPQETKKRNLDDFVDVAAAGVRGRLELAARQVLDVLDDMANVFLPQDSLLSSAGVVPVYYWLIRALNSEEMATIRSFLVDFEKARSQNRERVRLNPQSPDIDQVLVEYDNYNRSTNDAASHEGRYRILLERFRA
jgi:hypothetical protein